MAKSTREAGAGPGMGRRQRRALRRRWMRVRQSLRDCRTSPRPGSDYAQQVMHRTTEATESLLKCQSFNDMLAVQAELMRGHLQAFLDQSTKLAEITNRMAARSIDAIGEVAGQEGADKNRR